MSSKYSTPVLVHRDFDLSKKWYVGFTFYDPEGARKRFQFRGDINKFKTKKDRIIEANSLIEAIKDLLDEGWNPITGNKTDDIPENELSGLTLVDTMEKLNKIRRTYLRKESIRTYEDISKSFVKWLKAKGYKHIYPKDFTSSMAVNYLDSVSLRGAGATSYNKHKHMMFTYFNNMIGRKVVKKGNNPFADIKELRRDIGRNIAFSDKERELLTARLCEFSPRVYLFVQFMFYCALRRTEILGLKIEDINLERRVIRVLGKNRRQESVNIPLAFMPVLEELNLSQYPSHYYIFSNERGMGVGEHQRKKADRITDIHREHLRALGIPNTKTIYSWKHTGVVNLYNEIKDPYAVMRHVRHSDLQMTMIYLKSLGLLENEPVLNAKMKI